MKVPRTGRPETPGGNWGLVFDFLFPCWVLGLGLSCSEVCQRQCVGSTGYQLGITQEGEEGAKEVSGWAGHDPCVLLGPSSWHWPTCMGLTRASSRTRQTILPSVGARKA